MMDAKQLIENLIGAIEGIVAAADNSDDMSAAIEDAEDTANLAKLVLPSLAPPAAPAADEWHVHHSVHPPQYHGPFPDKISAEAYADALEANSSDEAWVFQIQAPTPHTGAPQAPAPTQAPPDPHTPFANVPKGGLYRN